MKARHRADEVRTTADKLALEGVGVGDVLFFKDIKKVLNWNVEATVRDETTFVQRVFVGVGEGDVGVLLLEIRKVESRSPTHRLDRSLSRPSQRL